jgi:hypothetical protein
MLRKSNLVPNSVSSFNPEKQLSRKYIVLIASTVLKLLLKNCAYIVKFLTVAGIGSR